MTSLNHDVVNGVLVLRPAGRIDASNAKAFEDAAAAVLASGPKMVVIDASELDYISSAGLRAILTTARSAQSAGGRLTLACARSGVKQVLAVAGYDGIFGLHDSLAQAVSALGA